MTKYRPGRFVERGRLEGAMDSMRKCSEKAATIFSRGIEGNGGHYYKKYTIFLKKNISMAYFFLNKNIYLYLLSG